MTLSDAELVARFAGVPIDQDNRAFYAGWLDHQLLLHRCGQCGRWRRTPRPVCAACWSLDMCPTPVRGNGTIVLLIWLRQGPAAPGVDYDKPYPVVTVELDEQPGLRYTSTLLNPHFDEIAIGDRVHLGWIQRYGAPFPVFVADGRTEGGGRGDH